ncbi:MAG: flippase [Candidatus Kuenenia stuttgartiensis]|nr:flippase [Candidatus Kuenenia stuttgartiensis]
MQKSETLSLTHQDASEDLARDVKKVAKGAGISFTGSAIGRCLFFAYQVIIARFFSAEAFGLFTLGLTVVRIADILARLGLNTGAMRFVSIYRKDDHGRVKGILIISSVISFISGIALGVVVYFCAGYISEYVFHKPELTDIVKTFAPCVPFMATMMVIAMASQGFHTTKYNAYIKDIIQPSANIVLTGIFLYLGFGLLWIIAAFVISHAIALLAGFYFIARQFPGMIKKTIKPVYETKNLLSYSIPMLFTGFLQLLILWVNIIMLGYMKSSIDVGIYRAASQIPIVLTIILTASNSIYAPAIAEMHHLGQAERLNKIFQTTTRWVFLLTLPVTLVLIFSPGEVMAIFGHDYVEVGIPVLMIMAFAQFVNCVTGGVGFTLSMTGKQHVEMYNSLVMVAINIAMNYFLIPTHGCLGAAIATGTSIVAINLVRLAEVYFLCKIQPYNMGYLQWIICGIIAGVALYFLDHYVLIDDYLLINNYLLNHPILVRLVSNSLIVCVIFVVGFFINGITKEDRFIFDAVAIKFKFKMRISRV